MSKNKFAKKLGVVVALSLLLGLGDVPNVSSAKALEKDQSFEMLKDWYEDYKVNGNEVVTGDETVVGDEELNVTNHAYYYLGRSIYYVTKRTKTTAKVETISIGYRAKRRIAGDNYINGFVTCGHGIRNSVDSRVYISKSNAENNKNVIGWRYDWCYDGNVDASFVQLNTGHTIKSQTRHNAYISSAMKTVKENDKVCLCGGVSGTLENLNVVVADKDGVLVKELGVGKKEFNNLIEIKCQAQPGDSGAIVYCYESGSKRIVGIYVAGDDNVPLGFVVPVKAINKKLKVTPY